MFTQQALVGEIKCFCVPSSHPLLVVAEGETHGENYRSTPWFIFPPQQPRLLPEDAVGAKTGGTQSWAGHHRCSDR